MTARFEVHDGAHTLIGLDVPHLSLTELKAAAVDCRVFFLQQEITYLPGVMSSLRMIVEPHARVGMQPLADLVNSTVRGNALVGTLTFSGVVPADDVLDAADPSRGLLGDDRIVMDWINGVAFHQDDEAAARLEAHVDQDLVEHAVLMQLGRLMYVAGKVRDQIKIGLTQGWITL